MKSDLRNFTRRTVRGRALLVFQGESPRPGQIKDLSLGGACLIVSEQVPINRSCTVAFEVTLNGAITHFSATANVIYCILSGIAGFRTGVEFTDIDAQSNRILAELMV